MSEHSSEAQEDEIPLLESLTPWLKCFCVVDFDLEYGQSMCTEIN